MKTCNCCKLTKDGKEFNKNRKSKDGLYSTCRDCKKKYKQHWYKFQSGRIARKPSTRFRSAKYQAAKRHKEWTLTQEEYCNLLTLPCHYCNGPLNDTGIGLDRLDNSKGYTPSNVVSSCAPCNVGRGDRFNYVEWKVAIEAVLRLRALAQR